MDKLKFWDKDTPSGAAAGTGTSHATEQGFDFRVGGNSTVVMSDYHLCKYDAILGTLICIGDDAKVLVLGKEMCREILPLPSSTHWLDAFVYTGTTTFLVLSPDVLLCRDYSAGLEGVGNSELRHDGPGTQFTTLHVPQGLTCGAVGRRDGRVSYFRLDPVTSSAADRPQLRWTRRETNVLSLCLPFCKSVAQTLATAPLQDQASGRFFTASSVLSIDSYPNNPNAMVAVLYGVPGVCKWYIDENRVSCYFDASTITAEADGKLACCRVTPGGIYVAAVTMACSKVLLWNESKKHRDKVADLYWVVDLSAQISRGVAPAAVASAEESFTYNEYRVGLHMARTALEDSFRSTNDKHSQMYLLLHGQRDILEVVIRIDDKQVIRREAVIAHLNAYTAKHGVDAAKGGEGKQGPGSLADSYFNVFNVEPCVLSNYWNSALTDVDLEALFVTSEDGLRPILAKRNRQTGGIESIKELRELGAAAPWYPRAMLLRLPETQIRAMAATIKGTPVTSTWEKLLRGGDTLLRHALPEAEATEAASSDAAQLWRQSVMVTVTDAAQAVCLSPQSNEAFAINRRALENCVPWSSLALGQDAESLVLETALPSLQTSFLPTELIVRVYATASVVMVTKNDVRRDTGSVLLTLDRAALQLEGDSGSDGRRMVQQAVLVNARLQPSSVTSKVAVFKDGKSLLLLLEDSSVALVDLCGKDEEGRPFILHVPAGLLPVGSLVCSLDAFWMAKPGADNGAGLLCLACLFENGKGLLLWNLSEMRMVSYTHPDYAAAATRLMVTAAAQPPLPNMSGDVSTFTVSLIATAPSQAAEYGSVVCCDALGSTLFTVSFAYGVAAGQAQTWCYRQSAEAEWVPLPGVTSASRALQMTCTSTGSALEWEVGASGAAPSARNSSPLQGTVVHVKAAWSLGTADLTYDAPSGEMRNYILNREASSSDSVSPAIALVGAHQLAVVEVAPFFATPNAAPPATVLRLDAARRVEHFSVYHGRGALIVVTRDANGWRWVNILDCRTAKPRMAAYATLDFAGEEHIQVLLVEIENILHLYFLGSNNGVVGHFFVEANLGTSKESSIRKHACFRGARYSSTPSTFRGYGRYLPQAPTLKQETGFFKRLMTLPWEDVALKLESETLRETKPNVAAGAVPPPVPPGGSVATAAAPAQAKAPAPSIEQQRAELLGSQRAAAAAAPAAATSAPPPSAANPGAAPPAAAAGGRYAQLKAIAERENVSLTEARRMMSENVRKLQERGERLNQIENKSAELAQNALTFADLATQLKEKQRSGWL